MNEKTWGKYNFTEDNAVDGYVFLTRLQVIFSIRNIRRFLMNSTKPISFHHKQILSCLAIALITLMAAFSYGYHQLKQAEVTTEWVNHTFLVIGKMQEIEAKVHSLVSSIRTYAFTTKPRYKNDFHKTLPEVTLHINQLNDLVADNKAQKESVEELRDLFGKLSIHYHTVLAGLAAGQKIETINLVSKGVGQVYIDQMTEVINQMRQDEKKLLGVRIYQNIKARQTTKLFFIISAVSGFILILFGIHLLYKEFRRRTEIQHRLDESNEIQKVMLESTAHAIIACDIEGNVRYFNPAAEDLLGYQAHEVLGKTAALFHVPEEMAKEAQELSIRFGQIIPVGMPVFTEKANRNIRESSQWTFVKKDGSKVPVQLSVTAQRSPDGNVTGYMGLAYDYSKQLQYEKAILDTREEALAGTRAKSEFLSNMSHEIRTPMNAILGMAELLNETKLDDEQKKYVEIFQRAGEGLLNIINDVLDLSKIETSHFELNKSSFVLSSLIAKTSEIIAIKAHQKQLEFAIDMEVGLHDRYFGDAQRIRQILLNLLGNAVKFTKRGEILLNVKSGKISDRAVEVIMQVNDTGIGMKQEHIDKLFERFTQADMSITKEYGGTGLGLNITKRLIELMNGSIKIESTLGVGTKITLTLNLDKEDGETQETNHKQLLGMKVLIVDDTRTNRIIFKKIVEYHGAIAEEASDGESAIAMIQDKASKDKPYDILLIDYRMPGMDGFKLAELIQQDQALVGPLIIMLTSDNRPGDYNRAHSVGIDSYLLKPILKDELLESIEVGLHKRKNHAEAEKPSSVTSKASSAKALKILLVDDNDENRFTIRAFMRDQPWIIDEARDGIEALKLYKERTYDLILMDIQMPQMDGYTCTKTIRNLELDLNQPRIPIIALTAYALKEDVEKTFKAGCDDHLPKPIRKTALVNAILQHSHQAEEVLSQELTNMIPGFLRNRSKELFDLKIALELQDFGTIQRLGHKLIGTAGSLNFDDICEMGRKLEATAKANDSDKLKSLLAEYEIILNKHLG